MSSNHQRVSNSKAPARQRAREQRVRARYKSRPSREALLATGDYEGPIPLGVFLEMRLAVAELRKAREAANLSLSQVAARSGVDKAALSRLERGLQPNPTVDTLCRYAAALGKRLVWRLADDASITEPIHLSGPREVRKRGRASQSR